MPSGHLLKNRQEAGQFLAARLIVKPEEKAETLVLALPRGGVPVAYEIAQALGVALDVLIVRKVGHPLHEEYGIGAVTEDGYTWLDPNAQYLQGISRATIENVVKKEKAEVLRRAKKYRGHGLPNIQGKNIILVDDGLATGVTARVAIEFLKKKNPKSLKVALPVCSAETASELRPLVDELICLQEFDNFVAVGLHYEQFDQTSDEEVLALLHDQDKKRSPLAENSEVIEIAEKLSYAKIVMLGEASHGTQEFYEWRRKISQELISKHGYGFIAVEGDWPDCANINGYIKSSKQTGTAEAALYGFRRWPTWMWANTEIVKLVDWLKNHNQEKSASVGFYGLDVYSLFDSIQQVLKILRKHDPDLAAKAEEQYACFDQFQRNEKQYAKSLYFSPGCEKEVLRVLRDVLKTHGKSWSQEMLFDAQQNARVVKNAENYYRTMIHGDGDSWNVRDRHMIETLNLLLSHHGPDAKCIVWAHNTHVGDYKATSMLAEGEINIGGLAREEWGDDHVALFGFGTYQGEVIASKAWDGPTQVIPVPPGQEGSYEDIFHRRCQDSQKDHEFLWLKDKTQERRWSQVRGHRAIGVVYNPAFERHGNYVPTNLSKRYDGFLFIDKTTALQPLGYRENRKEIPESWPGGF